MALHKTARIEDPGAELLDRATNLWDRYGRIVLLVVGAAVGIGVLGFFAARSRAASEEQAAGRLAEANVLFWQGDYKRSRELAREVGKQYPSSPSGLDSHRLAGDDSYWDGDFKDAIVEYQAYLIKSPKGVMSDAVRRSLAYALESSGQAAQAATAYDALVGKFDRESSGLCLAAAARCFRAANQPAEALKRLHRLVDEFGETSPAARARIEIAELSPPAR